MNLNMMKRKWILGVGIILIGMTVAIVPKNNQQEVSLLTQNIEALANSEWSGENPPPDCVKAPGKCMEKSIIWQGIAIE